MRFVDLIKFTFYVVLRNFKKYEKLPFGDTRVCPSTDIVQGQGEISRRGKENDFRE